MGHVPWGHPTKVAATLSSPLALTNALLHYNDTRVDGAAVA
jgi:hypothetical protein